MNFNSQQHQAKIAILLARVSSKDQEIGYSLEAQKDRMSNYCRSKSLDIIHTFEITESSTKGGRKQFLEMIRFAKSQKTLVAIVADKVDRVQRSFNEHPLLDGLISSGKIELHFVTERQIIHQSSNGQDRLIWGMNILNSQSYVDCLRDNVRRAQSQMVKEGKTFTQATLGYVNRRDSKGKSEVLLDETRAHLVRRIFEEYSTGAYTIAQMRDMTEKWGLNNKNKNGRPICKSHLHAILKNPFYYGMMRIKGQLYPHSYPALIDKSLFDKCQAVMKGWHKKPFKYGSKDFIFRGLISCAETNRTVSTEEHHKVYKNGKRTKFTYLVNRKRNNPAKLNYVREESVIEQVETALSALHMPDELIKKISEYIIQTEDAEQKYKQSETNGLKRELEQVERRLDSLLNRFLDNEIEKDDFDRANVSLKERRLELRAKLSAVNSKDDFRDATICLLEACRDVTALFKGSKNEEKRQFINLTLQNLKLDEGTLCFEYKKPFCWFQDIGVEEKWSD